MTKNEFKLIEACGYGEQYLSALRQAQGCADEETPPGPWVQPATEAIGDGVGWLWRNVLAVNKITVVAGAVGVGKSMLVAGDLAARVSAGSAWPDGTPGEAGDVLIASGNDHAEDTLVPRLEAHGANLERVHFLEGWNGALKDEPSTKYWAEPAAGRGGLLPALATALEERRGVKLVVIDPVSAFLDVGRGDRARAVLSGMQALARECSTSIVLITHLRSASQQGTLGVVGADGLVAAARMVWVQARSENSTGRVRPEMPRLLRSRSSTTLSVESLRRDASHPRHFRPAAIPTSFQTVSHVAARHPHRMKMAWRTQQRFSAAWAAWRLIFRTEPGARPSRPATAAFPARQEQPRRRMSRLRLAAGRRQAAMGG